MKEFKTHTGKLVTGARLNDSLGRVADFFVYNAYAVRIEDLYASHVTESEKDQYLAESLERAERIRAGNVDNFTVWQRVNTDLTGEFVALLN
jgi:hypothetical protein